MTMSGLSRKLRSWLSKIIAGRAKWIGVNPMVDTIQCSNCGYQVYTYELATPYCPECGKPMENYLSVYENGIEGGLG